jgi:Domain of unknown function (DUF5753)
VPSPGILPPLDCVYIGQLDDSRYLDRSDLVEKYQIIWDNLQAAALGPSDSAEFIRKKAADRYGRQG